LSRCRDEERLGVIALLFPTPILAGSGATGPLHYERLSARLPESACDCMPTMERGKAFRALTICWFCRRLFAKPRCDRWYCRSQRTGKCHKLVFTPCGCWSLLDEMYAFKYI